MHYFLRNYRMNAIIHNSSIYGWCILSHSTAIPNMVRQGDAWVYYLRVILMKWNILTCAFEVMGLNKLGKMCDVMWMVSRIVKKKKLFHPVVHQYWVKNSSKCIETILKLSQINIFNQKLQKKCLSFWEYLASNLW